MNTSEPLLPVTSLKLERSIIPWVVFSSDADVLACTPGEKPQWIPARSIAKGDWCLQTIPPIKSLPKILKTDTVIAPNENVSCSAFNQTIKVQPEFATLVGMVCATFMTRLSKAKIDEDTHIVLKECFPNMSIQKQMNLIVSPALEQIGISIDDMNKIIHQNTPIAGIALRKDINDSNPISLFRGNTGKNLFNRLTDMESPIPEALLYGILLRGTSLQHEKNGKTFLSVSGIRPEYYRNVLQLFWQLGTCPAPSCPKNNFLMYIYQHDVAASFVTDDFISLSASLNRFHKSLSSSVANARTQFLEYNGERYVAHRVIEVRHGVSDMAHIDDDYSQNCKFEIVIRNGRFFSSVDVSSLKPSCKDHRNRKSKEREQHKNGTFVPKRSIDKPSKYYERPRREPPTGQLYGHHRALFDGECQMLTPQSSVLAKDVSIGDTLIDGNGNPATVRKVICQEVDEDFCDLLTHHMGHLLVACDANVQVLRNIARGFTKEDLVPSGRNAHLKVGYPCRLSDAQWMEATKVNGPTWIPIPKPLKETIPTADLPTFDLAEFIAERDTVPKNGKIRFTITDTEVIWHCYKSFKAHEYDGLRLGDVTKILSIPRQVLRQIAHDVEDGNDITSYPEYSVLTKYLNSLDIEIREWAQMVKSPIDIAMPRLINISTSLAYLIGFYLADGTAANGCVGFSLDKSKPEEEKRIRSAMKECFPYASGRVQNSVGNGYFLNYSNPVIKSLFKCIIPQQLYDKVIPDWMMVSPDSIALSLLKGLIDGDGSTKNGRLSYAGASYQLVYQVRHLLMRFGVPARCSYSHIRNALGNMSVVLMLDAPLTSVIREMFDIPLSRTRQTLADEDEGYLVSRYQKSSLYHNKGTAYSFILDGSDEVATAAGIVRLLNSK